MIENDEFFLRQKKIILYNLKWKKIIKMKLK